MKNNFPPFLRSVSFGSAMALASVNAFAYEQATHAALTREAFLLSALGSSNSTLQLLGLANRTRALAKSYIDMGRARSTMIERDANPKDSHAPEFGPSKIDQANFWSNFTPTIQSIPGWLMLGAIREDDDPFDNDAEENTPQDEPAGPFHRVLNHFFDPTHDRALSPGGGQPVGTTAPDWAFNGLGPYGGINNFTIADAREAMWRAATLEYGPDESYADIEFVPSSNVQSKEDLRATYWATTFRALGDVVHLLQDMAQPQHTRNDPHSGRFCSTLACPGGHASYYEKYVDARVRGDPAFRVVDRGSNDNRGAALMVRRAPTLAGYPIPRFTSFADYFSTGTGPSTIGGLGLANYSNRGFYSAGTNVDSDAARSYASPPSTRDALVGRLLQPGEALDASGATVNGNLTLFIGNVGDTVFPASTATGVYLSSFGAFDEALRGTGKHQTSLNHYNYDAQMSLLLPRAVAYSAGLIDYFFRGQIDISLPDEGLYAIVDHSTFGGDGPTDPANGFKGFGKVRVRVANSTPAIVTPDGQSHPQAMSNGDLVAVVKFRRNLCYTDALDGEITSPAQYDQCKSKVEEIVVSDPVKGQSIPSAGDSPADKQFTFNFQNQIPINAWDVALQIVYRGRLGSEDDAVVVATKDIAEPTFVSVFNATDYVLIGGACYPASQITNGSALWNRLDATCRTANGANLGTVSPVCANIPLNISLTSGTATTLVTAASDFSPQADHRLLPRGFTRIAVLADHDAKTAFKVSLGGNYSGVPTSAPIPPYHAERSNVVSVENGGWKTVTTTAIDTNANFRGVNTWNALSIIVDGTTGGIGSGCPAGQLDDLRAGERLPQTVSLYGAP